MAKDWLGLNKQPEQTVVDLRKIWRWAAAGDYNDMFPAQGSSHLSYKQQPTQTECYMAGQVDSEWIWSGGLVGGLRVVGG